MDSWYCKRLGDGLISTDALNRIESLFQAQYTAAGKPADMAIYIRHESAGLHCDVVVYFSPAASQLARELDANPCNRPSTEDLGLLQGGEQSWLLLFPES